MTILRNSEIEALTLPGLVHQTLAGPRQGTKRMEVWMQTLSPGVATPLHRHACEEIIVVLAGAGTCEIEGATSAFGAGTTLVLEPNVVHRITNTGTEDMQLLAALSAAPVVVEAPDGARIHLPWDA